MHSMVLRDMSVRPSYFIVKFTFLFILLLLLPLLTLVNKDSQMAVKSSNLNRGWPKMKKNEWVNERKQYIQLPESMFMISCSFWTRDRTPGRRNSPSVCAAVSLMYCRALVMHGATARPVWRSRDVRDEPNTPAVSVSAASPLSGDVISILPTYMYRQVNNKYRIPSCDRIHGTVVMALCTSTKLFYAEPG